MRNEQIILKKFLRANVRPVFNESRKHVSIAAVLCSASDRALGVPACRNTFMINFYDSPTATLPLAIYIRANLGNNVQQKCAINSTSGRLRKITSYLEIHLHKDLISQVFFVPESISVREIFCARNHAARNYAISRCISLRLIEMFQNISLWKDILIASV